MSTTGSDNTYTRPQAVVPVSPGVHAACMSMAAHAGHCSREQERWWKRNVVGLNACERSCVLLATWEDISSQAREHTSCCCNHKCVSSSGWAVRNVATPSDGAMMLWHGVEARAQQSHQAERVGTHTHTHLGVSGEQSRLSREKSCFVSLRKCLIYK